MMETVVSKDEKDNGESIERAPKERHRPSHNPHDNIRLETATEHVGHPAIGENETPAIQEESLGIWKRTHAVEVGNSYHTYHRCEKNKHHRNMVKMKDFKMEDLPELYQNKEYHKRVMDYSERVVRIVVSKKSVNRPKAATGSEEFPVFKAGESDNVYGTGFLFPGRSHPNEECPCLKCEELGKKEMGYQTGYVLTARHVVYDDYEAKHSRFELFYDSDEKLGNVKTFYGVKVAGDEDKCVYSNGNVIIIDDESYKHDGGNGGAGDGCGGDDGAGDDCGSEVDAGDGCGGDDAGDGCGGDDAGNGCGGDGGIQHDNNSGDADDNSGSRDRIAGDNLVDDADDGDVKDNNGGGDADWLFQIENFKDTIVNRMVTLKNKMEISVTNGGGQNALKLANFLQTILQKDYVNSLSLARPLFEDSGNINNTTGGFVVQRDLGEQRLLILLAASFGLDQFKTKHENLIDKILYPKLVECLELKMLTQQHMKDSIVFNEVEELNQNLRETITFFRDFKDLLQHLIYGNSNGFFELCSKVCTGLTRVGEDGVFGESFSTNQEPLDIVATQKSNIQTFQQRLTDKTSLHLGFLCKFHQNKGLLVLNILVPIFVDKNWDNLGEESPDLNSAFEVFWHGYYDFMHDLINVFIKVFSKEHDYAPVIKEITELYQINTTDIRAYGASLCELGDLFPVAREQGNEDGDLGDADHNRASIGFDSGCIDANDVAMRDEFDEAPVIKESDEMCQNITQKYFQAMIVREEMEKLIDTDLQNEEDESTINLKTFLQYIHEGNQEEAILLARRQATRNMTTDDSNDSLFGVLADGKYSTQTIKDKVSALLPKLGETFEEMEQRCNDIRNSCILMGVWSNRIFRDGTTHKSITRLISVLHKTVHVFSLWIKTLLPILSDGDLDLFLNKCGMIQVVKHSAYPEFADIENDDDDEVGSTVHNNSIIGPTLSTTISNVCSLYSKAIDEWQENNCFLFMNFLIPLFTNKNCHMLDNVKSFWKFLGTKNLMGTKFRITYFNSGLTLMAFHLNGLKAEFCEASYIDKENLRLRVPSLTAQESKDHKNRNWNYLDGRFTKYMTDRVLIKVVTHDKNLIDNSLKGMSFYPPHLPFTFIISHPHGKYKHFALGNLTDISQADSQLYFIMKLTPETKFWLSGSTDTPEEDTNVFFHRLDTLTGRKFDIIKNSSYITGCDLTMMFPTTKLSDMMRDGTGWMKFPPGTICLNDEKTFDYIVLPGNLHFYIDEDVQRGIRQGGPLCFPHSIPTCPGSSGALINFSMCRYWLTHCGYIKKDGKTFGLSCIVEDKKSPFVENLETPMSVREALGVQFDIFSGPGDFKYHNISLFEFASE